MEALILGADVQAEAVAFEVRVPAHIEFARSLVVLAVVVLVLTAVLDLVLSVRER